MRRRPPTAATWSTVERRASLGDTFVINGNASAEAYRIYTRAAWSGLGNSLAGFNAQTEIIVARNGTTNDAVIAELREIEEIRINGIDPSGASGSAGDDTFTMDGDFSGTSLRLNTVTIEGSAADDTIDISGLSSSHRVVFHTNGGNDTVLGTPRPQDVIEGTYTVEDTGHPWCLPRSRCSSSGIARATSSPVAHRR